jgi:hypothetical protein
MHKISNWLFINKTKNYQMSEHPLRTPENLFKMNYPEAAPSRYQAEKIFLDL